MKHLIKNVAVVNEGKITFSDVLISNQRIEKIATSISLPAKAQVNEINGENLHLLPGCIDDQVHFREPGLTHKATIASESKQPPLVVSRLLWICLIPFQTH
jgi:dihydroorotase